VGSEVTAADRHPDYYYPFDDTSAPELRITQALDWLKMPEAERPHLITLYFSSPDHEGHNFGPQAEETRKAVLKADTLLSKLMKGLESVNLPVNVILVSDHGMAELENEASTFVFLDEVFQKKVPTINIVNGGTQAHVYVRDAQQRDSLYQVLKARENNFKVYRQQDFPAKWNYENSRSGDLLITVAPHHYLRDGDREKFLSTMKAGKKWGAHGFDPYEVEDMRGIFYAAGPNIKSGLTVPAFQNVNVYPLVAKILGLPLPPIDGKTANIEKIYRK
jgi:alkaline phosphatase D